MPWRDNPPADAAGSRVASVRTWIRLLPLLGFLGYAWFLAAHVGAYAGGSDSSGYLNNARLLAAGRCAEAVGSVPGLAPASLPSYTCVPLGFVPNPDHVTMTPTYPMGLPLLVAGAAALVGWSLAPALVIVLHTLAGVVLVHQLARQSGLESGWAWLGTLILASSPIYVMMGIQTMSDVPATVWVAAAVLAAWRSRERPWLALVAGTAFSLAAMARPSDTLALLPVAVALGWSGRRWVLLILGGLPGAILQGAFNLRAYGHLFTTGYGNVAGEFSWSHVLPTLSAYLHWLPVLLTPFGLLFFGLPWLGRSERRTIGILGAWSLVFALFYLPYTYTHEFWWYLRFLLPAFPAFIVGALLVARRLAQRWVRPLRPVWLAAFGAAVLIHGVAWSRHLYAADIGQGEKVYPLTMTWLQEHLPPDSVVAAMQVSGSLLYYTKFTLVRWDMVSPADFRRIATACAAAKRPVYAVLFPFESQKPAWDAFGRHLPGHWTPVGAVREVRIWRLDPAATP